MTTLFSLLGIVGSVLMLKYRESIGNILGEADWMSKVGGIYNVVIIIAIFVFFWSLSTLTGTTEILFAPLLWLIPGVRR